MDATEESGFVLDSTQWYSVTTADAAAGVLDEHDGRDRFGQLQADTAGLSDGELCDRLRAVEVQQRRLAAESGILLAEADRRGVHLIGQHHNTSALLRAETNCSTGTSTERLKLARLVSTVPAAGEALHSGRIGVDQARLLAKARANPRCGDRLAHEPDDAELLVDHCEQLSYRDAKICVEHWISRGDHDGAHRERESSEQNRSARVRPDGHGVDGTAQGGDPLTAAEMMAVFDRFVEAEFAKDVEHRDRVYGPNAPTDLLPRSAAQRHFDGLAAVFRAAASAGPGSGTPPRIVLHIPADQHTARTVLADHGLGDRPDPAEAPSLDHHRRHTDTGAWLNDHDLLHAAINHHIRSVIIDDRGTVINWGRQRRLFSGPARQAARFDITGCERPGCNVKATHSEVDHVTEWHDLGRTDQANRAIHCNHDNRAKHRLGVIARRSTDGYLNWHRPDGTYLAPVGRRPYPADADIERHIRRRVEALGRERRETS